MRAPGRIRSSWTPYAPPVSFPNNALNVTRIPNTQRLIPSPEFKHRSWIQVTNWSMKLWRLDSSGQISNTLKEDFFFSFDNLADWEALLRFPCGFVSAQMCNAFSPQEYITLQISGYVTTSCLKVWINRHNLKFRFASLLSDTHGPKETKQTTSMLIFHVLQVALISNSQILSPLELQTWRRSAVL